MGVILAKKIYENEAIVFNRPGLCTITEEQVNNTPSQAWLVMNPYCCGGDEQWQLEFQQPTKFINVLTGVWIEIGAERFLIDGNIADVQGKLGACCGSSATVIQNYGSGLPAYQAPVAKTYTLVRTDGGNISDTVDAELAYVGTTQTKTGSDNIVPNSFKFVSNDGTNSTYTFKAYYTPHAQGTDTITQTALVFNSNSYSTSLSGSNVYFAAGTADGVSFNVKGSTTFSSLVTALQADAVAGPMGTWSTAATHVTLTTTVVDVAVIVVNQEAP